MTDDEINERLATLLDEKNEWGLVRTIDAEGYTDPAVVVGLIELCKIDVAWDGQIVSGWCVGFGNDIASDTLPKAVALAAIKYLEQSK